MGAIINLHASCDSYQVGAVADFYFLCFGGHDQQFCSWVVHLQFVYNSRRITGYKQLLQMVDHHLVHACNTQVLHREQGNILQRQFKRVP